MHVAVVGQRQRCHPVIFGPLNQLRNRARSIEQRVMAVTVEVSEGAF